MEKTNKLSDGNAAFVAGIANLIMAFTVPFAEFGKLPKLYSQDPKEITRKLSNNETLFTVATFLNFISIICDVLAAWTVYIFLSPVNKLFSLLATWFILIFATIYLVALFDVLQIADLLDTTPLFQALEISHAYDLIIYYFYAFEIGGLPLYSLVFTWDYGAFWTSNGITSLQYTGCF